jgi:phage tail sheath protein FI
MPFTLSPSVTVTEDDQTLYPQEIADNIGAFAGVFQWGPVDEPTLVTGGEAELVQRFFKPNDQTYLPFMVGADFMSYASQAYVTRVVGANARNAVPTNQTAVVIKNQDDYDAYNTVGYQFFAKYPGAIGNGLTVSIADVNSFPTWEFKSAFNYPPLAGEFSVAVVDGSGLFTGAGAASQVERLSIVGTAVGGVQQIQTMTFSGTVAGGIKQQEKLTVLGTATGTTITVAGVAVTLVTGDSQVEVATKIATALAANAAFSAAYASNNSVYVTYTAFGPQTPVASASANGISVSSVVTVTGNGNFSINLYGETVNLVNGQSSTDALARIVSVFSNSTAFKNVTSTSSTLTVTYVAYGPQTVVATQTLGGLTIATAAGTAGSATFNVTVFGQTVAILNGDTSTVIAGKVATALTAAAGALGIANVTTAKNTVTYGYPSIGVQTTQAIPANQGSLVFDVQVLTPGKSGTLLEKYELLNTTKGSKAADGTTQYIVDALNASAYIWYGDSTLVVAAGNTVLAGGVDDNVGVDTTAAWQLYLNAEDLSVNYIFDTGSTTQIQKAIAQVADTRKDCFAFLSPQMSDVVNNKGNEMVDVLEWKQIETNFESSYLINDCNWGLVYDKYNDVNRWIPCSGGTAGLKARTDAAYYPWISPAGYENGQYNNYIKVAWSPNQGQRDQLYPAAVNPIVNFKGDGIILYGDNTSLTRPSAFQGITVRSAFIVAEQSLANFSKYYLFKLNDTNTRAQFTNACRPFLRQMVAQEAFEDVLFVADETNNTAAVRQARAMVANIYCKPLYSINYIQLAFSAVGSDVSFKESETSGGLTGLPNN